MISSVDKRVVIAVFFKIMGVFLGFLLSVISVKLLDEDQFSTLFYYIGLVYLLGPLVLFGFDLVVLKEAYVFYETDKKEDLGLLVLQSLLVTFTVSLFVAIVSGFYFRDLFVVCSFFACVLGFSWSLMFKEVFRSCEKFVFSVVVSSILPNVLMLLLFLIASLQGELSWREYLFVSAVAFLLPSLLSIFLIWKRVSWGGVANKFMSRVKVGGACVIGACADVMIIRGDLIVAGWVLGVESVSGYIVAQKIATFSVFLFEPIWASVSVGVSKAIREQQEGGAWAQVSARAYICTTSK